MLGRGEEGGGHRCNNGGRLSPPFPVKAREYNPPDDTLFPINISVSSVCIIWVTFLLSLLLRLSVSLHPQQMMRILLLTRLSPIKQTILFKLFPALLLLLHQSEMSVSDFFSFQRIEPGNLYIIGRRVHPKDEDEHKPPFLHSPCVFSGKREEE